MKYYTGIGSRETPIELKPIINVITKLLYFRGYTLRSGGADGADSFFEEDIDIKEIYLPWRSFNNNRSSLYRMTDEGYYLAEQYHPVWNKLSDAAKKLMVRNCYQVLGYDLQTPSDFIICWTKDGKDTGGTGQAIRLATACNIPVYNLYYGIEVLNFLK